MRSVNGRTDCASTFGFVSDFALRIGFFLWVVLFCSGLAAADWAYEYADDFATGKARTDSYRHSTFRSRGAVAPSEPYVYYIEINGNESLAFVDFTSRLAELGYRFPLEAGQAPRLVKGLLAVDVSFPSNAEISQWIPGRLEYRTSSDGVGWSSAQTLPAGRQQVPLASASGACYVLFSGTRAAIDNLAASLSSAPATILVPQDFTRIQDAIDAAVDGDVIEVAPGTYSGTGNRDIDFQGKAIELRSLAGPDSTIIDCQDAQGVHRGFYFHEDEGFDSLLSGFTIRSGQVSGSEVPADSVAWTRSASQPVGGGIYCEFSSPTIDNCIIQDCGAELGGGIGVVGAAPQITNCIIEECVAGGFGRAQSGGRGAAIGLIRNSNATISKCTLRDNIGHTGSSGVGLYVLQSAATVTSSVIFGNGDIYISGVRGGGAYCSGSAADVTFRNCILAHNRADVGAGLYAEGQRGQLRVINCTIANNQLRAASTTNAAGIQTTGADLILTNSILWSNTRGKALVTADPAGIVTYCDIDGSYAGQGNLSANPQFADPDAGDYHLKSKHGRYDPVNEAWITDSVQSPCIDAGDPSVSVADEPWPNGDRVNMGAYGGTKQASKGPEYVIWEVDKTGSRPGAFLTIQAAINEAGNGDVVLVYPGQYNEDLVFNNKAITVRSAADPAVLRGTDYAVSFYYGESNQSVLANFIITGCGKGAIHCERMSSPSLRNLTIVGNPWGISAIEGSEPNVTNCIIWGNGERGEGNIWGFEPRYSNYKGVAGDTKRYNIQKDPLFADSAHGDYHLKSQAGRWSPSLNRWVFDTVTSPCIDTGNPRDDYQAEMMPNGGQINMGAYGGTPFASKSTGG